MNLRPLILSLIVSVLFSFIANAQDKIVSSDNETSEYFLDATKLFTHGDYKGSIPLYQNVLKKELTLTKEYWYMLIDNLGMAYSITGDLAAAQKLFEYGLSKDNKYPIFYTNLACIYAEKNDMKACTTYLKLAHKYKLNALPGDTLLDPTKGESFQKFMKNNEFISTLKELE